MEDYFETKEDVLFINAPSNVPGTSALKTPWMRGHLRATRTTPSAYFNHCPYVFYCEASYFCSREEENEYQRQHKSDALSLRALLPLRTLRQHQLKCHTS